MASGAMAIIGMRMNRYDANSTIEKLRIARHLLVSARRVLWDIDEGATSDGHFANRGEGMHPRVQDMQNHLETSIMITAWMQDDLTGEHLLDNPRSL